MNKAYALIIMFAAIHYVSAVTQNPQLSPHIITFFFQPVPQHLKTLEEEKLRKTVRDPRKLLKQLYAIETEPVMISGIYATYAGFLDHSDVYGQIMFDRKTSLPSQTIIITQDIKPIPVSPTQYNTILGFRINPTASAKQFLFERAMDPIKKTPVWTVTEQPVAYKKTISFDTLVIFANPDHLMIPTGTVRALPSENIVLPDIYIKKNSGSIISAFKLLKLRNYFAPVTFKDSFDPLVLKQRVTRT